MGLCYSNIKINIVDGTDYLTLLKVSQLNELKVHLEHFVTLSIITCMPSTQSMPITRTVSLAMIY